MDSQNITENLIAPALVLVFALICWGALQATCAAVSKIEAHKTPVAVVARG